MANRICLTIVCVAAALLFAGCGFGVQISGGPSEVGNPASPVAAQRDSLRTEEESEMRDSSSIQLQLGPTF
jgi:hypothetical protein